MDRVNSILITCFSCTDVLRITVQGQPINGGGEAAVRNTKEEYGKLCIPVPGDDAQVQQHKILYMQYFVYCNTQEDSHLRTNSLTSLVFIFYVWSTMAILLSI